MRPTYLEVNISKFKENIEKIKRYVNEKEIMPVIKANAYGTYLNKKIEVLNLFNIIAVALVDEAIEIRKLGYQKEIFILNPPSTLELDEIEKYNLIFGLSNIELLNKCLETKKHFKVHLEIETGMNRTGIKVKDLNSILNKLEGSNIEVEGIYSHFSSADYDKNYSNRQIEELKKAIDICNKRSIKFKYTHISASNGLLKYNLDFTNLVRPGIIMYGYESYDGSCELLNVEPICRLISHITHQKEIDIGEKVGYSQKYTANKKTKVATIPIGYADGYRRSLGNSGEVLINNTTAKVIGNVCMDSIMVDTTNINCKVGDEVIIFDKSNIKLEDLAQKCNTINYEILCTISNRIPRIFIGGTNE